MAAQIRSTIELLTSILRENGTTKIRAEAFRQAKFDQEEAITPLWRLIFELLYYCEYGRIDEVAISAWSKFTTEEQVVYVKREMAERGFYSRDFANLPENQSYGSRELLLSFGWLMCKENIMHRFMSNRTSPLDDDTCGKYKNLEDAAAAQSLDLSVGRRSEPAQRVQQMLWLNNKLRISLRNLYSIQREKLRLKHKMSEATTGISAVPDRNHLTAMEIYMLKHPEMLKNNLKLLEKDSERLQHLLQWRSHEDTFWKWMESVLDAKLQNKTSLPQMESDLSTEDASSQVPSQITSNLVLQHTNLQEAILKYEDILDNLESMWQVRAKDVSEDELDSILASIDLELSIQRASIALNSTDHYLHTQPLPQIAFTDIQFVFEKNEQQRPLAVPAASVSSVVTTSTATDIQEEIHSLQDAVVRLQSEVNEKQAHFKAELEQLSSKLQQAICVPPMQNNI